MNYSEAYLELSPTTLAEVTTRDRILHYSIHQLWQGMPRIAGPAYPVRCGKGGQPYASRGHLSRASRLYSRL